MENNAAVNAEAVEAEQAVVGEEALPQKKQRKPINQQKLQDNLWGWIFCLPLIVGTLWFVFICLVAAILLSFTNYSIMSGSMFEFLGNFADHIYKTDGVADPWHWYTYAFTNTIKIDPTIPMNEMGVYLFNTVFYMIGIPIGMILAMFFAVCMTRDIPGANVFRVIYYFPCVASTVSIVYTFRLMFNQAGVFNQLFGLDINWINTTGAPALTWNSMTGSASTSAFMVDPFWCQGILSKCVIIIMSVWKGLGGTIILYIAGSRASMRQPKKPRRSTAQTAGRSSGRSPCPTCTPPSSTTSSRQSSAACRSTPSPNCSKHRIPCLQVMSRSFGRPV